MDKRPWPTGIRPSGNGIRIKIWRKGQLHYSETLAGDPFNARDLAAAVKRREELIARLRLGLPLFQGDESAACQTLVEAAQEWLSTLDAKRSTHLSYENILNQYWLPAYGTWPVTEISTAEIKKALGKMRKRTRTKGNVYVPTAQALSLKAKKNILIPLRGALDHAGVNPNPARGVKFRKRQKDPIDRYTPQQRTSLLNALQGEYKLYFALLFGCGLRPCGEPLALQWSDYDGEELDISKQITKRRLEKSTKTSVRRRVYVPTWVRDLLNNHPTRFQNGHIFVNTTGGPHLDSDKFNDAWRAAHKKARIPYRVPYACRHTRAAELLSLGIDAADAAKQLGHSPEMFLRIYAEWIEEYSRNKDKRRFEGVGITDTDKIPTTRKGI